jgi:two-component system CheB/CheR fusion protein
MHSHTKPQSAALRVLVVDDDLDTAHSMAWLLRDMGHDVQFAINGYAALDVAKRFRPTVVLLDLGLPDFDGCVLAGRLRREAGLDAVRIVAVTGKGEEHRERALQTGCDGFYRKPLDPRALQAVLGNVSS